jgi:hypothetical protein
MLQLVGMEMDNPRLVFGDPLRDTINLYKPTKIWLAERPPPGLPEAQARPWSYPRLEWEPTSYERIEISNGSGVLDEFVRLHDAPLEQVLSFARRWGLLLIRDAAFGKYQLDDGNHTFETLFSWYGLAREARGILLSTAKLTNVSSRPDAGSIAPPLREILHADLFALNKPRDILGAAPGDQDRFYRSTPPTDIYRIARSRIADAINQWLFYTQLIPMVRPQGESFQITLVINSLFALLATQVVGVVSGSGRVYECDLCHQPFTETSGRRLRADRGRYCPRCSLDAGLARKKRWWQEHGAEWRQRRRTEKG